MTLSWEVLENRVGKGETAGHQHFLLFPLYMYFLLYQKQKTSLQQQLICPLQNNFKLVLLKNLSFGKEFT